MGKYLSRIGVSCLLSLCLSSLAISASLPEGAVVKISSFTFPKAAYTESNKEANRLSEDFYGQLVTALEEAGLQVDISSNQEDEKISTTEKLDSDSSESDASDPKQSEEEKQGKEFSAKESLADEKEKTSEQTSKTNTAENDQLMQLVNEVEKEEKAKQETEKEKKKVSQLGPFVMTGTITQYEELVGVPVNTGNTKRSRVEVSLLGSYKVEDPSGKTIILEKVSASVSRVVPETMDIYQVIQSLSKKTFFDATHSIAERLSGKKRLEANDEAEPGSEDDDYADSPGKRLKSKSGRMKWIIN